MIRRRPPPAASLLPAHRDEADRLLSLIADLKRNTRTCAEHWIRAGMPDPVPWDEHHVIAERLIPLRAALSSAPREVADMVRSQIS